MIKEWNLLRVIACLTIVALHSTTHVGRLIGYPQMEFYHFMRTILCYATPTFIVLSEIILANRYKNELPRNFFTRRFKYIMMPFITFAIIDAFIGYYFNPNLLLFKKMLYNIFLGTYEGYFVLIIMQFYILHYLVLRFKISMKFLFPFSLVVMFIHLYLLNYVPYFRANESYFRLPFTAWFAYFTTAYLIGKNYELVAQKLKEYRWYTLVGVFLSAVLVFINYKMGNKVIFSRRMDLYPLVISISSAVLAWGQIIPNFKLVNLISRYSFPIYLIHWQLQIFITPYIVSYFNRTLPSLIALFIVTLAITMLTIRIISFLPYSYLIVGNVKRRSYELKGVTQKSKQVAS